MEVKTGEEDSLSIACLLDIGSELELELKNMLLGLACRKLDFLEFALVLLLRRRQH
jgi:hypothetical protein